MNKLQDSEVRRMAVFKLRQVARQLAELEPCATEVVTRARLAAVRAGIIAASERLQTVPPKMVLVEGDDETRLMLLRPEVASASARSRSRANHKLIRRSA